MFLIERQEVSPSSQKTRRIKEPVFIPWKQETSRGRFFGEPALGRTSEVLFRKMAFRVSVHDPAALQYPCIPASSLSWVGLSSPIAGRLFRPKDDQTADYPRSLHENFSVELARIPDRIDRSDDLCVVGRTSALLPALTEEAIRRAGSDLPDGTGRRRQRFFRVHDRAGNRLCF